MKKLLNDRFSTSTIALKELLAACRKVTICLDGWTKKGLSCSFLGISACFFDPVSNKARHAVLNLHELPHPHTGIAILAALEKSLVAWNIDANKVLLIVSDNGSNVVKAVQLLQTKEKERVNALAEEENSDEEMEASQDAGISSDDDAEGDENDERAEDVVEIELPLPEDVAFRRMPCMAHTLQLIIKEVYKKNYAHVIMKARHVVSQIKKSSVAIGKLQQKCGKNVVTDCSTRWNSTFFMAQRLMEIKTSVNEVLAEMGIDTLLVSEWAKLQEMAELLEPFASQTDILQTDALSLSYVLPSILDLECHLQQFPSVSALTKSMLSDLRHRFSSILDPRSGTFNPLPVAACLVDHRVSSALFSPGLQSLLESAKLYLISQVSKLRTIYI